VVILYTPLLAMEHLQPMLTLELLIQLFQSIN